jgi:hypothetical protein
VTQKILLFLYHLHPIIDYKIHFTLKKVRDLLRGREKRPIVFECAAMLFVIDGPLARHRTAVVVQIRGRNRASARLFAKIQLESPVNPRG